MDAATQGELYIVRNIDGFEYILKSIHIESVRHLEKELETTKRRLDEAVGIIKFYSIPENAGYNHELDDNVEWIDDEIYQRQGLKARQFLAKLSKEEGE